MSPTFPLLRLPLLAFENVVQFVEFADLILLSQCSNKAERLVKQGTRALKHVKIDVSIGSSQSVVALVDGRREELTWTLIDENDYHVTEGNKGLILRIEGDKWKVLESASGWKTVHSDQIDALFSLIPHLKTLFFQISIRNLVLDEIGVNFKKLLVHTNHLHVAERIRTPTEAMYNHNIAYMLNTFITDNMEFNSTPSTLFKYSGPIRWSNVAIQNSHWIDIEKLLEMMDSCKQIDLRLSSLKSVDLNRVLKYWLDSDSHLEKLQISVNQFAVEIREEKILEGIRHVKGCKKRADSAEHFQEKIKYEKGVDIVRKDGKVATWLRMKDTVWSTFLFTVWQHPTPNLT